MTSPDDARFPGSFSDNDPTTVEEVLGLLEDARRRTYRLVAPLDEATYRTSLHPVMGPVAWDVGHIGQQEDLWLVQTLGGRPETAAGSNALYDAYRHPRPTRASLPLPGKGEVRRYHERVRRAAEEVLRAGPKQAADPLWKDLFVPKMVVLHEHQHNETILQHLAAMPAGRYVPSGRISGPPPATAPPHGFARIAAGPFTMGLPRGTAWTYDNEWEAHAREVDTFWLQRTPVTNAQFLRFVTAGGYDDPTHWDPDGFRAIVEEEEATAPMYWCEEERGWSLREMDRRVPLPLDHPVANISWYEADAFARWAGCRLPTEEEWEKAATLDPKDGAKRRYPWGDEAPTRRHANLDQERFGTDPVGSHPEGASPHGIQQLIGDVWEWTASRFTPYPGFKAFPYREYSEIFFDDDLRVLRGGSWATRPWLRLGTFRNWDLPRRRQIFAGLRLASSAPPSERTEALLREGPS